MPKLKNQLPKLCENGGYAFVRYQGKKISLGKWGTSEARQPSQVKRDEYRAANPGTTKSPK